MGMVVVMEMAMQMQWYFRGRVVGMKKRLKRTWDGALLLIGIYVHIYLFSIHYIYMEILYKYHECPSSYMWKNTKVSTYIPVYVEFLYTSSCSNEYHFSSFFLFVLYLFCLVLDLWEILYEKLLVGMVVVSFCHVSIFNFHGRILSSLSSQFYYFATK